MIEAGTALLEELEAIVAEQEFSRYPRKSFEPDEVDRAPQAKYRVATTLIPYVKNPERRVYEMTQERMDEFFDGYSEFAEFVIRVEEIR